MPSVHFNTTFDPSFLESVDIYFDKAAAIASTTPDILAQIKVENCETVVSINSSWSAMTGRALDFRFNKEALMAISCLGHHLRNLT
jgi:hypothetical protein